MSTSSKKGSGSGDDDSPRHVVVERVVSNIGSTGEIPKLSKTNYHEWALEMQVNLEGMELWDAVEAGNAERGKDRRALAVILRGVPPEMKSGLAAKKSAKEAWAAVKFLRMGDARVQEAKAQYLLKQFELAAFKDGEAIDDFAVRIDSLAAELRGLGEKMEEERVVKKMLRVVPSKYNQIACTIEMFGDLKKMSLEELVGRLRVAEERCGSVVESAADGVGRLLLTEERWEDRRRQRDGKQRACGGEGARRDSDERRGRRNDDHSDNNDDDDRGSTSSGSRRGGSRYRGRCFECGERGHRAKDCRGKKKERALLADVDDEPMLL
ncbi:uncharacterized protein LOC133922530 [Phragmites australis]|uniref:uncharacterized protein LOC133922530 n=1 Tax=Phragmites australis TaxID=29695 RepID=UPI002D76C863|nr:uncharacterized protein LOC133922530 [Phragmites australis]